MEPDQRNMVSAAFLGLFFSDVGELGTGSIKMEIINCSTSEDIFYSLIQKHFIRLQYYDANTEPDG